MPVYNNTTQGVGTRTLTINAVGPYTCESFTAARTVGKEEQVLDAGGLPVGPIIWPGKIDGTATVQTSNLAVIKQFYTFTTDFEGSNTVFVITKVDHVEGQQERTKATITFTNAPN